MNRIKWLKLKSIVKEITEKEVEFVASTHPSEFRAFVVAKGNKIEIYLNMEFAKDVDDVIKSLAHEVAHVLLNDNKHTNKFRDKWNDLTKTITEKYKEVKNEN